MPQNEPEALPDGQTELKKRSRRRLVGAAALALLAVVVLPMVMDDEPKQPVQDLQVRIPSQDSTGVGSRILPAKPVPTPLPADDASAKPEQSSDKPEAAKSDAVPIPAQPPGGKAVDQSAAKAGAKPDTSEKADKADKIDKNGGATARSDAARAAAVLNGADAEEPWLVLLGAYKDAANVKQLVAKVKQLGLPAYTEHFDSPQGARTRVRCGPFRTRDAAERAAARIRKIGVDGQVAQGK